MATTDYKAAGNKAFAAADYPEAIRLFTLAIEADPAENHILYSNRSAAHAAARDFAAALEDAKRTTAIASAWPKGYSRLAAAHIGLGNDADARDAIAAGLAIDPANAALLDMKKTLDQRSADDFAAPPGANNMFENVLRDPQIFAKLAANPATSALLADAAFCQKLRMAIDNPQLAMSLMSSDTRMMQVLLALMGINIPADGAADAAMPHDTKTMPANDEKVAKDQDKHHTRAPPQKEKSPTEPVATALDPETVKRNEARAKREAGNAAYRARKFAEARELYDAALEMLDGKDAAAVTNNIAALEYERGDYVAAEEFARRALELGRAASAGFEFAARALLRAGKALEARGDQVCDDAAAEAYRASLAEHRTADALTRLHDLERRIEARRKAEYHSPALSVAARERGDALFAEGKHALAVPEYTEAVKRDETDPRAYAARSAAYLNLLSVQDAMRDAQKAISLDEKYIKGYLCKIKALLFIRNWVDALETCETAERINLAALRECKLDATDAARAAIQKDSEEISKLMTRCYKGIEEVKRSLNDESKREETLRTAMQNPEIQAIMSDPAMRIILDQMSTDPRAAREHMADPVISAKIRKLVAAGIVSTR